MRVGDATSMSQGLKGFDVEAEADADVIDGDDDVDFSDLMFAISSSKYFNASCLNRIFGGARIWHCGDTVMRSLLWLSLLLVVLPGLWVGSPSLPSMLASSLGRFGREEFSLFGDDDSFFGSIDFRLFFVDLRVGVVANVSVVVAVGVVDVFASSRNLTTLESWNNGGGTDTAISALEEKQSKIKTRKSASTSTGSGTGTSMGTSTGIIKYITIDCRNISKMEKEAFLLHLIL